MAALSVIMANIMRLNQALGHTRGVPRVTRETATPAQRMLVLELEAWHAAERARLDLDSAVAQAGRIADGEYHLRADGQMVDEEGRTLPQRVWTQTTASAPQHVRTPERGNDE